MKSMLKTDGIWFKDEQNRTLLLRGVNLGGSSKVPYPDGATYIHEGFFEHRGVSFVGRPFPLEEAGEHFRRLKAWGLTTLRFLVTWEALEHSGPGQYDEAYLDYLRVIVRVAGEHGLTLFIDPHQDVWSRFTGGDGAPGWTLEAVGFDMTRFAETGAAVVHQTNGDPFPRMIWPTNNHKLAAATLWTLFFGGNDFAPATKIDGEPAQDYLQRHYIAAIQKVAERLADYEHVLGYDTLNEPAAGYIGLSALEAVPWTLKIGPTPTPFQSMLLGAGLPQEVDFYELKATGPKKISRYVVNPNGVSAWRKGCEPVWKQNGVWDMIGGQPCLLRPDHFARVNGRAVKFNQDYFRPFVNRFAESIRQVDPDAIIFVEVEPHKEQPVWGESDACNIVFAPHWYDAYVLMFKDFNSWLGVDSHASKLVFTPCGIRVSYAGQVERYQRQALAKMGGVPTVIGETGIAFDLQGKRAYKTGDFRTAIRAMDRTLRALDDALVSYMLWNYTADNTNMRGDLWNDEDLSIFSRDQQADPDDINSGGRALEAVVRPYACKTAGEPLKMSFDIKHRRFDFEFRHDPAGKAPTEIFVPNFQYPRGIRVTVSDGTFEYDKDRQVLIYRHTTREPVHRLRIEPGYWFSKSMR
jgi:hypothetical protein